MNDFADTQDYEEVSIKELDGALLAVRETEADYDRKKKVSSEAKKELDLKKTEFMTLLKRSGKSRWETEGLKGFSMYDELKWRVPNGLDNKGAFFSFLKSEKVCGLLDTNAQDLFLTYASVHSASFNTLCKQLKEIAAENGEDLHIPGTEAPKAESKLRSLPSRK